MSTILLTRQRRLVAVAAAVAALGMPAASLAQVALAGVPAVEHPVIRPSPEEHDFDAPKLCDPKDGSANCGTGSDIVDYLLIAGVGGLFIGLVRRLRQS